MSCLRTLDLSKQYHEAGHTVSVLNNISLSIEAGETVSIMGASGSGKSTLLQILAGLDTPSQGQLYWDDQDITQISETMRCTARRAHIGYLYQFHHLLPEFSVIDNIAMPLMIQGQKRTLAHTAAEQYARDIQLTHRLHAFPSALSGGERQRVALARALIARPRCLLADEPTGNLDQETAIHMATLLITARQRYGCAIIMVTHNPRIAEYCDQHYILDHGQLRRA